MTGWLSTDEQEVWRRLLAMTSQLEARLNRQLQEQSGLSLSDYDILVPLSESPGARLRVFELAARLNWEQSRLSHHLARMQQRDLVGREDCKSDRRGAFIILTGAGRQAVEQAAPDHAQAVRQLVFTPLTPGQLEVLSDITDRVLARLASTADPGPG